MITAPQTKAGIFDRSLVFLGSCGLMAVPLVYELNRFTSLMHFARESAQAGDLHDPTNSSF